MKTLCTLLLETNSLLKVTSQEMAGQSTASEAMAFAISSKEAGFSMSDPGAFAFQNKNVY